MTKALVVVLTSVRRRVPRLLRVASACSRPMRAHVAPAGVFDSAQEQLPAAIQANLSSERVRLQAALLAQSMPLLVLALARAAQLASWPDARGVGQVVSSQLQRAKGLPRPVDSYV